MKGVLTGKCRNKFILILLCTFICNVLDRVERNNTYGMWLQWKWKKDNFSYFNSVQLLLQDRIEVTMRSFASVKDGRKEYCRGSILSTDVVWRIFSMVDLVLYVG